MNKLIHKRVVEVAHYILSTKKTIREVANDFNVSKSTIHKDLSERLILIDKYLYNEVQRLFNYHKSIRHIRGGLATKRKYKNTIK